MKISIIHASYGRPELARETHHKWRRAASDLIQIEWLLSIDKSDPLFEAYKPLANDIINAEGLVVQNDTNTSVAAINYSASVCSGDLIMVISDDFEPVHHFDEMLELFLSGKSDFIVKTQDGTQGWIITLPIMDRMYYNRFGYIYHPSYTHMFCDTELTCVADYLGRKLISDILFKHNHYSVGGIKKDSTSIKADLTWNQGEQIFLERFQRDFFIPSAIKPITDKASLNWINQKLKAQHGQK